MPQQNIEDFKAQVMLTLGLLYEKHPIPVLLNVSALMGPAAPQKGQPGFDDAFEAAAGTMQWLITNGAVSGRMTLAKPAAAITGAQLTKHALNVLTAPERNLNGECLGDYAIRLRSAPNPHDEKIVADLIFDRLG